MANAEQAIGKLPLLTEAERRQLVEEWNRTEREYPRGACIHELFEAQVERTPEAIALVFQEEQLTYRELNEAGPINWGIICGSRELGRRCWWGFVWSVRWRWWWGWWGY